MSKNQIPLNEQIQVAKDNLDRLLDWVGRYDNKSSIILGINTGMLGALAALVPIRTLSCSWASLTSFLTLLLLGISFIFVYMGVYPRLKGPPKSLLYFGSIASIKLDEYKKTFLNQTEEDYLHDLLEQCHINSRIVEQKFFNLKWAYRILLLGIIPWTITLYLS